MDDLTRGMVEIRHVDGGTRAAYDDIYSGPGMRRPERTWRWLLDLVGARPGMRLLDVACGEGELVRVAALRGLEAHGVDLSAVALRAGTRAARAGGEPGAVLAAADGEALPYPDRTFDRVTCFGSLEHYADPRRGAAEMARVLKPGGRAALVMPNTFGLRWNVLHAWRHGDVHDDGQPLQRYGTRGQWSRVLAAGGLDVERVVGFEAHRDLPAGLPGALAALRHPSRLLVPLARHLPADMASELAFVCVKPSDPA